TPGLKVHCLSLSFVVLALLRLFLCSLSSLSSLLLPPLQVIFRILLLCCLCSHFRLGLRDRSASTQDRFNHFVKEFDDKVTDKTDTLYRFSYATTKSLKETF